MPNGQHHGLSRIASDDVDDAEDDARDLDRSSGSAPARLQNRTSSVTNTLRVASG